MSLQEDLRPTCFEEVIGNEATIESILSVVNRPKTKVPQAMLFHGPPGCGKTTLARIVASYLKCSDLAFHEYDAALDEKGINTIREIKQTSKLAPTSGSVKVYMLDECHMLTKAAQEGLLKMLEKPIHDTFFFLCTTHPQNLLPTIQSRCSTFQVFPNTPKTIRKYLKKVCRDNEFEVSKNILKLIATSCQGSMRDALKMLDQIKDMEDEENIRDIIEFGLSSENEDIINVARILLKPDPPVLKWKLIAPILRTQKKDPESSRLQILGYLNAVFLNTGKQHIADLMECFVENYYSAGKSGLSLSCFNASQIQFK